MSSLVALWKAEPVLVLGVVQAVIALAIAFGFSLTPGQVGAIVAVMVALNALIARSQVAPYTAPPAVVQTPDGAPQP